MPKKLARFFKKINFDSAIRFIIYVTVFLIPLFYLPIFSNPWNFGKAVVFSLLILLAVLLWLIKMVVRQEFRWHRTPFDIWIGLWLAVYLLVSILSLDKFNSFWGTSGQMGGSFISLFILVIFYYLLINHFKDSKSLKRLLFLLLFSFFIILVVGWLSFIGLRFFPDAAGFLSLPLLTNSTSVFSLLLAVVAALAWGLWPLLKQKNFKIFLIVFLVLDLVLLFIVGLAIGLLIFLAALFFFILLGALRFVNLNKKFIIASALLLALSLLLLFIPLGAILGFNFQGELSLDGSTAVEIARLSLAERPLSGTGPLSFHYNFTKYKPIEFNNSPFWDFTFSRSANLWLELLVEGGILTVLFLALFCLRFIFFFSKRIFKQSDQGVLPFLFICWLLLIIASFIIPFNWLAWFFFWLFAALATAASENRDRLIKFAKNRATAILTVAALVLLVVGGAYFVYQTVKLVAADVILGTADVSSVELKSKAKVASRLAPREARYHLLVARESLRDIGQNSSEEQRQLVEEARQYLSQAIARSKFSSFYLRQAAEIERALFAYGDVSVALESIYNKVLRLDPNNPIVYSSLGRLYLEKSRTLSEEQNEQQQIMKNNLYQAAEQFLTRAVSLKTDFAPAYYYLSILRLEQGDKKTATALMEKALFYNPTSLAILFDLSALYIDQNRLDEAESLITEALKNFPDNLNLRWHLAVIYDKSGQAEKAREELQTILQSNPDFQPAKDKLKELELENE